jgi:hypothetical protein
VDGNSYRTSWLFNVVERSLCCVFILVSVNGSERDKPLIIQVGKSLKGISVVQFGYIDAGCTVICGVVKAGKGIYSANRLWGKRSVLKKFSPARNNNECDKDSNMLTILTPSRVCCTSP